MTTATVTELPATAAGLLAFARSRREAADRMEAELLQAAVHWALLHPARGEGDEAGFTLPGSEHVEPIAGEGCPAVSEFCIAEFGAVVGLPTVSAKHYLGQALELAHRLPRLWRRVRAGTCPAWKARRIADTTIHAELAPEGVAYVDRQVAPFAHKIGTAAVDRLVDEAIARFHPDRAATAARDAQDARHVTVEDDQVSFHGTMRVEAELDLADALDFRDAVARGAKAREQLGSESPWPSAGPRPSGTWPAPSWRSTSLPVTTSTAASLLRRRGSQSSNPPGRSCSMSTSPTLPSTPQGYFPDRWTPSRRSRRGTTSPYSTRSRPGATTPSPGSQSSP